MALEKLKIPEKILSFMKDVIVDVITKQIGRCKGEKEKTTELVQFSSIEFEREMRSRVNEIENQVVNIEAVIRQGKRLYESVIKSFPGTLNSTVQIDGDVSINVYIINCPDGARIVGQDVVLDTKRIEEVVDCEIQNSYLIDKSGIEVPVESTIMDSKENSMKKKGILEKYYTRVEELRKL